jgi:linoleoyl-CoA desaturase
MGLRPPLKFTTSNNKEFGVTLNERVEEYFSKNNISKSANAAMVFKSLFHISMWAGAWYLIVFGGFSPAVNYILWPVLGFFLAMAAVNIGHDAIHGAYSKHEWINRFLSHSFNINGASSYMWRKMHNTAHHTYTNVDGYDEDIQSLPILRLNPEDKLRPIHRFQHIFAFFIYPLGTLSWVFIKDYVKFFKNDVGNYSDKKHPAKEYFYLFFYKVLNYTVFLILPLMLIDMPWHHIVLGYVSMHFVSGFTLAMIFMLAHVVEETHFIQPDHQGKLKDSFAVHQLLTTADFAGQNWLAAFLTGGLNTQVEHHLYPKICSCHYAKLVPIVKQTAQEFGVPYYSSSFWGAVKSHYRFMKRMGREANYQPVTAQVAT